MIECPKCGSTTQVRKYDWDISFESDNEIIIYTEYLCVRCRTLFKTERLYRADGDETVCEEGE